MSNSDTGSNPSLDIIKDEIQIKVIVVGDPATGKTSIIQRFVKNEFSSSYKTTIGLDFFNKRIAWDESTDILLRLWDIAGQKRFENMTRNYYKDSVAAIIVFDCSNYVSFQRCSYWVSEIDLKVSFQQKPLFKLLLCNKCDLKTEESVPHKEIEKFCNQNNFIGWFETSAKDNIGIEAAIKHLLNKIINEFGPELNPSPDVSNVKLSPPSPPPSKSCC